MTTRHADVIAEINTAMEDWEHAGDAETHRVVVVQENRTWTRRKKGRAGQWQVRTTTR